MALVTLARSFDARLQLMAAANPPKQPKQIARAPEAEFRLLEFDRMSPDALGTTFGILLNLDPLPSPEPATALAMT